MKQSKLCNLFNIMYILENNLNIYYYIQFSSVQSLTHVQLLQSHEVQDARPPCLSLTPGVYSNSCPLSQWCHPTISSSVVPFSSNLQSFPASESFQMSQFFASGGQSTWCISFSTSPSNEYSELISVRMDWLIFLQSKGLQESSPKLQFSINSSVLIYLYTNSHIYTWLLEKPWPWLDWLLLAK